MIAPAPLQDPDDIKVFILYLLNRVGYPLKYDRVGDIVVQDGMVNFMDFGTYFFELLDAGHIKEIQNKPGEDPENPKGHPTYTVSETGKVIAEELKDRLLGIVREKSYQSAIRYLDFAKRGAVLDQNYRPDGDGYLFHCEIKDRQGVQLDLTVRADNEYQLKQMRYVYSERPEVVFKGIIALLTGEVNYLFDKD